MLPRDAFQQDLILKPDQRRSKTPQPQRPANGYNYEISAPNYQSRGGAGIRLPHVSKSQELRNQSASSSQGERNGTREDERYQIRAPPAGSYQDDDTGPSPKNLVMAVMGVKSAVIHFAKALISDMNRYPEELKQLKQTIRRELHSEVDRANHWKFLVQAFVCKRLFEDFEAENGFFGIRQFDELKMSTFVSFADFSSFKDKAVTITDLLAKNSPDVSFLGRFCFKKFKSISGDLASDQPWPLYAEDWRIVNQERHPRQSEFYQSFLKIGVSVWLLHRLVWSFEQDWKMLGWDKFPQFSKFEKKSMESVVPGGFEEDDDETGTDVNTVVGFVVIPGFQVSKSVVKCEVYLRNLNNMNSGRIMEASEVPARERSLEKAFSDKTSASFQTPPSSQPGGSFRSSESMAAGGSFRGFDSFQAPPSSQPSGSFRTSESKGAGGSFRGVESFHTPPSPHVGGSFRTSEGYGAVGSFQSPEKTYSKRSPASLPTPDSAKSSSNHSGPLSRASAETKYWESSHTQEMVSGVISRNNQGKSSRSRSEQLDGKGRTQTSQHYLPAMTPSAKQSRPGGVTRDNFLSKQRREEALNRRYGGPSH